MLTQRAKLVTFILLLFVIFGYFCCFVCYLLTVLILILVFVLEPVTILCLMFIELYRHWISQRCFVQNIAGCGFQATFLNTLGFTVNWNLLSMSRRYSMLQKWKTALVITKCILISSSSWHLNVGSLQLPLWLIPSHSSAALSILTEL